MQDFQAKPYYKDSEHFKTFWSKGNGKLLQEWSGAELSFKDWDKFAPYFYQYDEVGDRVVRDVYFKSSFAEATSTIKNYIENGVDFNDPEIAESLKVLFKQTENIPDWLDWNLIEKGSEVCQIAGLNALIILRDYVLMGGYDYAYLNKPLILTGALKKGAVKRLADTLNFWVNVTRKDALQVHKKGYGFCITTRLIHSYSRLMILEKNKNWDTKNWGLPINSWDMMATYIGFSLMFLHGLQKLEVQITDEDEAGLFHLWKYIGYLIGIPNEILPNDKKEATEFFFMWTATQPSSDEDSKHLAKSLLDENLETPTLKYQFQRRNLRYLHVGLNWFLLDDETNKRLGIEEVKFPFAFAKFLKLRNRLFFRFASREKQIQIGASAQEKVLADYLKTAPRNKHH